MPRCNGLQATHIKAEMPETRIVIVTVSDEEEDLFEAIKSGAEGYVLEEHVRREFSRVLSDIAKEEAPLSKGLAHEDPDRVRAHVGEPAPKESAKNRLSVGNGGPAGGSGR